MATVFTIPRQVKINVTGIPYAGALATFYQAGTLIKQSIYQDAALQTEHENPVPADDDGYLPVIWLNPNATADYRVMIRSATGVLLDDEDNIPRTAAVNTSDVQNAIFPQTAAELAAGVTPTYKQYAPGDIRRYGTVGVTDDSTVLVTALSCN